MNGARAVFLCDGVRTPFGRFRGGLSTVRTDDLAALPLRHLMDAPSRVARRDRRRDPRLREPGRRGQSQRRAHGRVAGWLAGVGARRDGQSPVRVRARSHRPGRARDRAGRSGPRARRRCRRHVACAVRDGQGRRAARARSTARGHHARLAFRQPGDARTARCRFDDADGRTPRPRTEHHARRPGRVRAALAATRSARDRGRAFRRRDRCRSATALPTNNRAPTRRSTHSPRWRRCSAPTRPSPRATRPASTTAPARLLLASAEAVARHGLTPRARVIGMAAAGVPPRTMGLGPVPAIDKLLRRLNHTLDDFDVIEINEAFAAQVLACTRALGLPDDAARVNPNGGAIALGHPLGASGARLALTAALALERRQAAARAGRPVRRRGPGAGACARARCVVEGCQGNRWSTHERRARTDRLPAGCAGARRPAAGVGAGAGGRAGAGNPAHGAGTTDWRCWCWAPRTTRAAHRNRRSRSSRRWPNSSRIGRAVQLELGIGLGRIGRGNEALAALRRAVALDPVLPQAWLALADHLSATGDSAGAQQAYANHVRHSTRDPALMRAGAALADNRIPEAEALLRAHLKRAPTDVAAIRMLAEVGGAARPPRRCRSAAGALRRTRPRLPARAPALRDDAAPRTTSRARRWRRSRRCCRPIPRNPGYRNLKAVVLCRHRRLRAGDGALRRHPRRVSGPAEDLDELRPRAQDRRAPGARRSPPTAAASRSSPASARPAGAWPTSRPSASTPPTSRRCARSWRAPTLRRRTASTSSSRSARRWRTPATTPPRSRTTRPATRCAAAPSTTAPTKPPAACDRACRTVHPRVLRRARRRRLRQAPDPIFIVGLPRAGSTLIEQILSSHSAVEGTMELPELISLTRDLRRRTDAPESTPYHDVLAALDHAELARARRALPRAHPRPARKPARRSSSTRCRTTSRTSA